jgi:hypothetical protein
LPRIYFSERVGISLVSAFIGPQWITINATFNGAIFHAFISSFLVIFDFSELGTIVSSQFLPIPCAFDGTVC